jgi:hypothetical protein
VNSKIPNLHDSRLLPGLRIPILQGRAFSASDNQDLDQTSKLRQPIVPRLPEGCPAVANRDERTETYRMEVKRIDVVSSKPFGEVVAALEQHVPIADMSVILRIIASRLSAQEIERAIGGMLGELGFLCWRNSTKDSWFPYLGDRRR